MADAGSAAFRVSGLELGGLFGSLLAGRISDALIARDPKGGNCGKRVQVCAPAPPSHQAGRDTFPIFKDRLPALSTICASSCVVRLGRTSWYRQCRTQVSYVE